MRNLSCYIFSVDFNKAKGKLEEIISEKKSRGVELVEYRNNICCAYVEFSDGEMWKIVSAANSARGIK